MKAKIIKLIDAERKYMEKRVKEDDSMFADQYLFAIHVLSKLKNKIIVMEDKDG